MTGGQRALNATVRWLADRGVGLAGARTLTVTGRSSGNAHRIPVNPLTVGERRYLVAPRGVTDWVRNVRIDPRGQLRRGRHTEDVVLSELGDDDHKLTVVADYLARWGWEVGSLLPAGLTPRSDEETLRRYLGVLPVFEVTSAAD
ncbi:hypothetical protein GOHSU_02_00320 [Gordonia hirsuta DSM 44140 = NBRC 16056]|uniref:Deazaflavin-dependent nitroreductase n=1 Tax=Gordonia hirsuta DSM 44140 = NBRC 16056 TaxID=1121927 RepID=L7L4L4_9ACTN|nr:nitroreductase/quinone reductase family protein [Gordonia hirsuta]GAC55889.1 hypothetical protein GOHSU_02_00320 [Gordonia hirsuta DSM 44140 = NBRC 16056]